MSAAAPRVVGDAAALATAAARHVIACAERAIETRGGFRLALPGGRSVAGMLAELARDPMRDQLEWDKVVILFADERAVSPSDTEANYRLVRETLLDPLGERAPRVRRMRGEAADLEEAAREYDAEMVDFADLVVLGLGEDAHVASLFPGSPLLADRTRRAAVVDASPKPPARRLTLLPRALAESRQGVLVLASGAAKAQALRAALAPGAVPVRTPATLLAGGLWLADRDAANG